MSFFLSCLRNQEFKKKTKNEFCFTRLAEVRLVCRPLLVLDGAQLELPELRRGRIFPVVDKQLGRHGAHVERAGRGRRSVGGGARSTRSHSAL